MENFFKVIKTEEPKPKKYVENEDIELLYNKYEPLDFNSLVINKDIGIKLKNIIDSKDILNLYIYGPYGSGKYLLSKLYVNGCIGLDYKLNPSTYTYDGKELDYLKNNYVCEININNQNFNDINFVSAFLGSICNKEISGFTSRKKIIVIRNIHLIKKIFYVVLKNYIDKYSTYNLFVFISRNFIPYIFKGFFCLMRVPSPSNEDLFNLGKLINNKAKKSELEYIIKLSNRSITKFKNIMEISYLDGKYDKYEDSDNDKLRFLYKILYKKKIITLTILRDLINELFIDNMKESYILEYLINSFYKDFLKNKIDADKIDKIRTILVETDLNIKNGFRPIHHLEYAFIKIINLL